jgi:NADPH:quinone reductase-like Zn-dependent oxidoreductase
MGGNSPLSRLRRALTPHGMLVIVGGEDRGRWTGMDRQLRALALSPFVGQRLTTFGPKEHYTVLDRLTELIEVGQLVPVIEQTYPLSDMPNAMRHLQAGRHMTRCPGASERCTTHPNCVPSPLRAHSAGWSRPRKSAASSIGL